MAHCAICGTEHTACVSASYALTQATIMGRTMAGIGPLVLVVMDAQRTTKMHLSEAEAYLASHPGSSIVDRPAGRPSEPFTAQPTIDTPAKPITSLADILGTPIPAILDDTLEEPLAGLDEPPKRPRGP